MITVLVITLITCIIINIPIAVCLGVASFAAFMVNGSTPLLVVAQRMFTGLDSTTLLAIPLFVFAGKVMERGGISKRLVDLAYEGVGFLPGSLGMVTVIGCMFFAALSGSAPATVVAIGGIMVPIMIDDGYPAAFSATLAAASGTIGVIIPPSIPFVNYAMLSQDSVGDMFIAGVVPGLLMGAVLLIYCLVMSKKNKWGREVKKFNIKTFLTALRKSFLALLMPLIVLGGIYGGVFTPTEAAAVSCVYGILVSGIIYKELNIKELPDIAFEGGLTSAMILFIIATANSFSWIITTQQVPVMLTNFMMGITDNTYIILFLINIALLINGCFMELTASIFIFVPILLPLARAIGMSTIQFGIMVVLNMTLGLLTPPLGINLFVAKGLDKRIDFNDVIKQIIPMFALLVVVLLAVTYVPSVSLGFLEMLKN